MDFVGKMQSISHFVQIRGPFEKFVDWGAVHCCHAEGGSDCYAKL